MPCILNAFIIEAGPLVDPRNCDKKLWAVVDVCVLKNRCVCVCVCVCVCETERFAIAVNII